MTHSIPPAPGPASRPDRTAFDGNCPCLSGEQYDDCCGRFHRGDADAPTAGQLMRSRYWAFVVLDSGYLLRTWHASTRPAGNGPRSGHAVAPAGHPVHARWWPAGHNGAVEFAAHYRLDGERGVQRETSRFVREDRRWYYVDGVTPE